MSLTVTILFVIGAIVAACVGGHLDNGARGARHVVLPMCLYAVAMVMLISAVFGVVDAVRDHSAAEDAAIATFENRYGVSINEVDFYSERPSRWLIDEVWRECYVTDDNIHNAKNARLMCDVYQPGKPKFAELAVAQSRSAG